jgi:hypothetical protein
MRDSRDRLRRRPIFLTNTNLAAVLRGRRRAAAAVVVLLAVGVLLPLGAVIAGVLSGVRELSDQVRAALEGHGSLAGALLGGGRSGTPPKVPDWADLASRYGASAWAAISAVARASAGVAGRPPSGPGS